MATIDREQYDELCRIMGSDLSLLVDSFEKDCQQRIAAAREVLSKGELAALRRIAHTLKGGALGMAAQDLAGDCKCLEAAAIAEDRSAAGSALLRVEKTLAETLGALNSDD